MNIQPPPMALPFDLETGTEEYYQNGEIYDHDFKWYKRDKKFYLNMVKSIGGPILEFGCGTGRLMYPWIKENLEVTGVDLSSSMLEKAEKRLVRLGKKRRHLYELIEGDMRSVDLHKKFKVVVSAFNSMMHLYTHEDIHAFLDNVVKHLDKNGTFLFDVLNPDFRWLMRDPEKRWAKTRFKHPVYKTWYHYTTNHFYDAESQIAYVYIYHEPVPGTEGPSYMMRLAHRMFFPQEMMMYLKMHGFKIEGVFGYFDGTELDLYSPCQVYVCSV